HHIRHLLDFKKQKPIDITPVHPPTQILKTFNTPPITYPSISPQPHQTFPHPINQIPPKTNTPQPPQHPSPYQFQNHPTNKTTPIKQLPSPPFPLTTHYLQHPTQI
ncbi:glutamate synthase-related protein, partial [Staphylococcus capitis]|uniref:glutamate synthase-related protein n=1 Tax=Staphylococcus capitis TaxID=29388 RepID=UPI0011AA51D9